jgi:hypothetical protein
MTPPIRQEKRKNRPQRILITSMGCLFAVGMLTVGALLGGLLGAVLLPDTFGWSATQNALLTLRADIDETAIALAGRELALANTQTANNTRATQNALNAAATLAALTNQQSLIDQTATRSARDIIATQTSIALENARQGTQVALDYAATQAGLQREATQVELNYQQTQAALGNSVLPNSQSDAVANASVNNPSATPTQTQRGFIHSHPVSRRHSHLHTHPVPPIYHLPAIRPPAFPAPHHYRWMKISHLHPMPHGAFLIACNGNRMMAVCGQYAMAHGSCVTANTTHLTAFTRRLHLHLLKMRPMPSSLQGAMLLRTMGMRSSMKQKVCK